MIKQASLNHLWPFTDPFTGEDRRMTNDEHTRLYIALDSEKDQLAVLCPKCEQKCPCFSKRCLCGYYFDESARLPESDFREWYAGAIAKQVKKDDDWNEKMATRHGQALYAWFTWHEGPVPGSLDWQKQFGWKQKGIKPVFDKTSV